MALFDVISSLSCESEILSAYRFIISLRRRLRRTACWQRDVAEDTAPAEGINRNRFGGDEGISVLAVKWKRRSAEYGR